MPATTPNPAKSAAESNGNSKNHNMPLFVDLSLTREQKEHLVQWIEETEWVDLLGWVDKMVEDGHTISIKPIIDAGVFQNAYIVSVTGTRLSASHVDKCLTARASTPQKALFSAMYRDTVILGGIWVVTDKRVDLDV